MARSRSIGEGGGSREQGDPPPGSLQVSGRARISQILTGPGMHEPNRLHSPSRGPEPLHPIVPSMIVGHAHHVEPHPDQLLGNRWIGLHVRPAAGRGGNDVGLEVVKEDLQVHEGRRGTLDQVTQSQKLRLVEDRQLPGDDSVPRQGQRHLAACVTVWRALLGEEVRRSSQQKGGR